MPFNIYRDLSKKYKVIEIKQSTTENFINGMLVQDNRTKDTIIKLIKENTEYIIKFYINNNVTFSKYLSTLVSTKEAVEELRNEYSRKLYSKSFESLDYKEKADVIEKYPFRFLEAVEEEK